MFARVILLVVTLLLLLAAPASAETAEPPAQRSVPAGLAVVASGLAGVVLGGLFVVFRWGGLPTRAIMSTVAGEVELLGEAREGEAGPLD